MNVLETFTYHDTPVRTVIKDGEAWFVAIDIARILGYRDAHNMVRRIDSEDKGTHSASTPGGAQNYSIISEPGLYVAVLGSQVEGAKAFRRWITHDVIPAIRKTGGYQASMTKAEMTLAVIEGLQSEVEEGRRELAVAKPKAEFADTFLSANGDYDTRDAAQILRRDHGIVDIGQNRLRNWMQEHGWLGKDRRPLQPKIDADYLRLKPSSFKFTRTNGEEQLAAPQVRVTPKGVEALARALKKELSAA